MPPSDRAARPISTADLDGEIATLTGRLERGDEMINGWRSGRPMPEGPERDRLTQHWFDLLNQYEDLCMQRLQRLAGQP